MDGSGRVLGRHDGIHRFTVGQRKGLGLTTDAPRYVTAIDAESRRVVVGTSEELECGDAYVREVCWIAGAPPSKPVPARVRVRYRHPGARARVEPLEGGRARVVFEEPVRAVSPGQAAVFYDAERGEEVLGGGWLMRKPL